MTFKIIFLDVCHLNLLKRICGYVITKYVSFYNYDAILVSKNSCRNECSRFLQT